MAHNIHASNNPPSVRRTPSSPPVWPTGSGGVPRSYSTETCVFAPAPDSIPSSPTTPATPDTPGQLGAPLLPPDPPSTQRPPLPRQEGPSLLYTPGIMPNFTASGSLVRRHPAAGGTSPDFVLPMAELTPTPRSSVSPTPSPGGASASGHDRSLERGGLARRPALTYRATDVSVLTTSRRPSPAPDMGTVVLRPQLVHQDTAAPLLENRASDAGSEGGTLDATDADGASVATESGAEAIRRLPAPTRLVGQARLANARPHLLNLQLASSARPARSNELSFDVSSTTSKAEEVSSVRYPPSVPGAYPFPVMQALTGAAELSRVRNPDANFFGIRTRFRPLCLLALGAGGNIIYGTGSVILERGVWSRGSSSLPKLHGPNADGTAHVHTSTSLVPSATGSAAVAAATPGVSGKGVAQAAFPDYNAVFGGRSGGLAVGGVMTGLGMIMAAVAATMFWRDARRLVRRNHASTQAAGRPSYLWPNVYYSLHLTGIALLVSYRFLIETTKDTNRPDWVWVSTLPGVLGSSIFSLTQAQAFSSSELYNGKMPLKGRAILSGVARSGVATYCLFAAMAATPNFNPYWRELTRLAAMTFWTVACALPLTTARHAAANPQSQSMPTERTSHKPAIRLGLVLAGRVLIGFGPGLFERGLYTALFESNPLRVGEDGINKHHFSAAGREALVDLSVGACLAAVGVTLDCVGNVMARQDMRNLQVPRWRCNALFATHALASANLVIYRAVIEFAKDKLSSNTLWLSTFPGVVGTALHFISVPEQFSYSELLHGDVPMGRRETVTKLVRSFAGCAFPLWAAMSAIIGFNQFAREGVFIAAAASAIFAMGLPTTTTRRGRPQFAFPRTPGLGYAPSAPRSLH